MMDFVWDMQSWRCYDSFRGNLVFYYIVLVIVVMVVEKMQEFCGGSRNFDRFIICLGEGLDIVVCGFGQVCL